MKPKKYKVLTNKVREWVVNEVKMMFAAHRDTMWYRWESADLSAKNVYDPLEVRALCNDGYYGEAFGIMRALAILGYGYFGSSSWSAVKEDKSDIPEHNLRWWFETLFKEYLEEEGYFDKTADAARCHQLLEKYRGLAKKS